MLWYEHVGHPTTLDEDSTLLPSGNGYFLFDSLVVTLKVIISGSGFFGWVDPSMCLRFIVWLLHSINALEVENNFLVSQNQRMEHFVMTIWLVDIFVGDDIEDGMVG